MVWDDKLGWLGASGGRANDSTRGSMPSGGVTAPPIVIPAGLDIRESFTETEGEELYKLVRRVARPCMRVVEIGSWKGFSTVYLAKAVSDYNGTVFAVDHWLGSPGAEHHQCAQTQDILALFRRNMCSLGCDYFVKPMVMGSLTAAEVFADKSLDLVFIDGDHRYSGIKADIEAWLPKIRWGGILCGHDGSTAWLKQPPEVQELIRLGRETDYLEKYQLHPGVTLALHELLADRQQLAGTTCIWWWQKTVWGWISSGPDWTPCQSAKVRALMVVKEKFSQWVEDAKIK